ARCELFALDLAHDLEHSLVEDVPRVDLLFDHLLSGDVGAGAHEWLIIVSEGSVQNWGRKRTKVRSRVTSRVQFRRERRGSVGFPSDRTIEIASQRRKKALFPHSFTVADR